jgi:adenylosuccinate lyase
VIRADRMKANLESSFGLVFSQPVLLALVAAGVSRDSAYRIVQRDARRAWEDARPFRSVLEADADVAKTVSRQALDEAFSLERALRHACRAVDALEEIEDREEEEAE